jgi:hypothetical protein
MFFLLRGRSKRIPPTRIPGGRFRFPKPSALRFDFTQQIGRNLIHASDSVDNAKGEIALWFKHDPLVEWKRVDAPWVFE